MLWQRELRIRTMCDQHQLHSQSPAGDIDHKHYLSSHIGALFENSDYSDVTLKVEGIIFRAHKVILAARSDYFRALFFGGLSESGQGEVELKETKAVPFKHLLKYIYTGTINLTELKEEILLEVLGMVHQYGFADLESSISDYLKAVLSIRNVCFIYDLANMYTLRTLTSTSLEYMDQHAEEILTTDGFLSLSDGALSAVIKRDSFCAKEIEIFKAVCKWKELNPQADISNVLGAIRLALMTIEQMLEIVRPSGIIKSDMILDAIETQTSSKNAELNFRGFLLKEENIATTRYSAQVLKGENKTSLLDGDVQTYDLDRGFTRHPIEDSYAQGIVVKLGRPSIINKIRLLLWDRDTRSYSYTVDVSMDEHDWFRVVDYSHHLCRSWQTLYFEPRVVKYIKVVGTHNTVNRVFHLVSFECYYMKHFLPTQNGIVVPTDNVATLEATACVIEGVSRSRNALINGDTQNYDWDQGYTCHQLGSGSIVVQLAQPYMIGSMRLLLWDCDDRSYSYKIEVSTDLQNWQMVMDKTQERCQAWQTIVCKPRPVTFIKIIGTHNTANEVFHCVHFECPIEQSILNNQPDVTERPSRNVSPPVEHPHNPNQFPINNENQAGPQWPS